MFDRNATRMTSTILDAPTRALEQGFRGALLRPGNDAYEGARKLWNGVIDKRPALIARCRDARDVLAAVGFARDHGLSVAVRGGGHNVAGFASTDGGIVIDLSGMRGVEVFPEARVARVAGGATWGDVDCETQAFGLATPGGLVSKTGVAGLTLGGGVGWLRRKYGLSCDNLLAAEVVTADGRLIRASETEHADLLWGLKGGGGNFGVVTSFEFRLHPVGPEVAFAFVLYPLERAKEVLRFHETFLANEPGEVSTLVALGRVPHADPFPEAVRGAPFIGVLGVYASSAHQGEGVLRPLREIASPLADLSGPMPYLEVQKVYDADYPDGMRYYWKSTHLTTLTDEVINLLVEHAKRAPSVHATIDLWYHGGAVARPADATAYGRRDLYLVNPEANWERPEDDAANIAWARRCVEDVGPFSEGGSYLNFPGFLEEGEAMVRAAYGENYARLVALKSTYDPQNLFRINQNIKPVV